MSKSIKLFWNAKTLGRGDALGFLFGDRKETVSAAKLAVEKMKQTNTLSMTKRELRFFAKDLESGKLGVKYSYHNFYTKLLRKLLDLGGNEVFTVLHHGGQGFGIRKSLPFRTPTTRSDSLRPSAPRAGPRPSSTIIAIG